MRRSDLDDLEQRLAARMQPALPPELRLRVLAGVHRALVQPERTLAGFITYVLPAAAAVLVCANLFLSLLIESGGKSWNRPPTIHEVEPFALAGALPPGVSEREVQKLALVQRLSDRWVRPPTVPASVLRALLQEESSK